MKLHPRVTPAALALARRFEGFRARAEPLPEGGWIVGHGHTRTAREGAEIGEADAEALLRYDLSATAFAIEPLLLAPVTAPQFEALLSFAFNIGVEAFSGSSVLRRLNAGAYLQAASGLELWRQARVGGDAQVVDALVRRRAAEKAHFLTPPEGFAPAPGALVRPLLDRDAVAAALALDETARPMSTASPDVPSPLHREPAPSASLAAAEAVGLRLERILAPPPTASAPAASLEPPPSASVETRPPLPATRAEPASARPVGFGVTAAPTSQAASTPGVAPSRPALPLAFVVLGLAGVALFASAIVRMLGRPPSPDDLVLGLLGVAALAPAAIFFLFRFSERVGRR